MDADSIQKIGLQLAEAMAKFNKHKAIALADPGNAEKLARLIEIMKEINFGSTVDGTFKKSDFERLQSILDEIRAHAARNLLTE